MLDRSLYGRIWTSETAQERQAGAEKYARRGYPRVARRICTNSSTSAPIRAEGKVDKWIESIDSRELVLPPWREERIAEHGLGAKDS